MDLSTNETYNEIDRQKVLNKKKEGLATAKATMRAAMDEKCDWKIQPLSFIRGEVCGSHYKVLGIDRNYLIDKNIIKKAFRQKSLLVHPDKNSSPEADTAFKYVQAAYDCLIDDSCRNEYNSKLDNEEALVSQKRKEFKHRLMDISTKSLNQAYYHVSLTANYIYQFGLDIWDFFGDWEVDIAGIEKIPIGRTILMSLLLLKGQLLLKMHTAAYIIVRINYEIAKARGII